MQTFLPYPDFIRTAKVLDFKRLGKQRVEAGQILTSLQKGSGWSRHPAVLMWKGFEDALIHYRNCMIEEWVFRGYRNTMEIFSHGKIVLPAWFGDDEFHASHRSNLLRKDGEWYGQFGWEEPDNLEYVWPVKKEV
jgi:ribosomal protein L27